MPFDAGVMSALVKNLKEYLTGARIEKVYQPERDEIILNLRNKNGSKRLLISATPGISRVCLIEAERENPMSPPMFCMLLRKHLTGGHIIDVNQVGFDRVLKIDLMSLDELGFQSEKHIICEILGTYSNIILLDENYKIISVLHPVSISETSKRKVLPGFSYENVDKQEGKTDALDVTKDIFFEKLEKDIQNGVSTGADKYLVSRYSGLSPLIAREIVFLSSKATSTPINLCDKTALWFNFEKIINSVKEKNFSPSIVFDKNMKVVDFSFFEIRQYGASYLVKKYDDVNEMLEVFYEEKDKNERIKRRGQDILRLLSNAQTRIKKKTELQRNSLEEHKNLDKWKLYGDLITANIYMLQKGMSEAKLVNYFDENMPEVTVKLDTRYTPSQNAQAYYKKYNKAKSGIIMLSKQIEESRIENEYIETVFESLTKAENESDLSEIRAELSLSGYGKKLDNMRRNKLTGKIKLKKDLKLMKFLTSDGHMVYCGKNNLQNDYVTTKLSDKNDYWFHVKNAPGSHVLLKVNADEDPPAETFTECAMIAAYFSSEREKPQVCVDYTRIKFVKKPSGAKPGFVVYDKNYSAYVTADKNKVYGLITEQ